MRSNVDIVYSGEPLLSSYYRISAEKCQRPFVNIASQYLAVTIVPIMLGVSIFITGATNNTVQYGTFSQLTQIEQFSGGHSASVERSIDMLKIENQEKIEKIRDFKDNWNGYGAGKFDSHLMDAVSQIILVLDKQPQLFPTGRNSIQLEYENSKGDYMEFEVFGDIVSVMIENAAGGIGEYDIPLDDTSRLNLEIQKFYEE